MSRFSVYWVAWLCLGLATVVSPAKAWDRILDPVPEPSVAPPLASFHRALVALERGERDKVRVLHFGDSHTAADMLTGAIRRSLQGRFGNGGRGFVLLGHPWKSYRPQDITVATDGRWNGKRIVYGDAQSLRDGRFGLSGIASEPADEDVVARISAPGEPPYSAAMERFELWYLAQPSGGRLKLSVDRRAVAIIQTDSPDFGLGVEALALGPGPHEVAVSPDGSGPVRIFGGVVEVKAPGVVYDSLGVNGAVFDTVLSWDRELLSEQVRRRDPQLLVIMYGTNDAGDKNLAPDTFARTVERALRVLRAGAPKAACLVIGPPDIRSTARRPMPTARLDRVISVEADVARAQGCGFVDARQLMGGPGSFGVWQDQGLAMADGVHFTPRGYAALGQLIVQQLLGPAFGKKAPVGTAGLQRRNP